MALYRFGHDGIVCSAYKIGVNFDVSGVSPRPFSVEILPWLNKE